MPKRKKRPIVEEEESEGREESASEPSGDEQQAASKKSSRKKGKHDDEPQQKKKAKAGKKIEGEEVEEQDGSLFGMVKNRTAMAVTVTEWIARYQEDVTEAMRELLNFILKACGHPLEVSRAVYNKEEIGVILANIMKDEKYIAEGGEYPIAGRGKFKQFKKHYLEFWDKLINKTKDTILYDESFLSNLTTIAAVVSSSMLRPLRHTATLLGLQLLSSIIKVVNALSKDLQVTLRHIKTTKAKSSGRASKSETSKVRALEEKAEDLKEKINYLDDRIAHIFNGIFANRHKDISEEIRAACATSLGDWIETYPIKFLSDLYLKYLGWMLHDRAPTVRLSCVQALIKIYQNDQNIASLSHFTNRFKSRIIHCTLDKETKVAIAAIELSTRLAELGALDDEEMDQLNNLISDKNVSLRFAAAVYLNETVLQSIPHIEVDKKAQIGQLKALLSFITMHSHQPKNPNYIIDALWPQAPVLKAWNAMVSLLCDPNEELEARERSLLASLVNACVKKASGLSICPKEKSDPDATIKSKEKSSNQRKFSKQFAKRLPELLEKCNTEPDQIEELVELPQYFELDVYRTHHYEKHFAALLERLHNIYLTHGQEAILKACAKTYKVLVSQEHPLRKEAEVAFGQLTDELAERFLQELPTISPEEGPVELEEESEFTLRMTLKRIHHLYAILNLARLDLYDPVKQLLDAQVSGLFPSKYEKIMVHVVGVLGQHLFWSAATFKPKVDNAVAISHKREELTQHFCKLLQPDVATPDVQDKAYFLLCDLALVFRPGIKNEAHRQLAAPLGSLPKTLRTYLETALSVQPADKEGRSDDEEEEEEEEGSGSSEDEDGSEDGSDEDDNHKAKKRKSSKKTTAKKKPKKAKKAKKTSKSGGEDEDLVELEDEESKARRERPLTAYETMQRKVRLIAGLAKLVVYNVIPREKNASALLMHYANHGKQVSDTLRHFLAQLKAGDENVHVETSKTWVIVLDTMKKKYQSYLEADDGAKPEALKNFVILSRRLAATFGIAHKKTRNVFITLAHSGIMYAAEDAPNNFHFLSGLHRFVSSLASQTTAKYILTTFNDEMHGKYDFDESDKACDPYFAFLKHLQKAAHGKTDDEAQPKAKGKGKGKDKAKKSRIPSLEFEKVPDRPKVSKTTPIRIGRAAEESEEEEESS